MRSLKFRIEGEPVIADYQNQKSMSSTANRRVLMVAFHFPPIASSPGALRSRAFADYLPEHGWEPHVLAPIPGVYDAVDAAISVPEGAHVHRAWVVDARRQFGWRGHYPAVAAIPDRWISWLPAAVNKGLAVVKDFSIDAIWSTYPISTSHLIAGVIARRTGLPWIAEFRDPVQRAGGRAQYAVQQRIERYVIRHSNQLIFVTEGARRAARARFPEAAYRMNVIANGFDEALEKNDIAKSAVRTEGGPVTLVHSGHLYPEGRNPQTLLEAVSCLKRSGQLSSNRLRIVLRNTQQDQAVAPRIAALDIGDIVCLAPWLPHAEALAEQRAAHGLLLLQGTPFNTQVPAKLFEYVRSGRPVLALVDEAGDTAALLDELGTGRRAPIDDIELIADALMDFIHQLTDNPESDWTWRVEPTRLARYSRRAETADLGRLLDAVTGAE